MAEARGQAIKYARTLDDPPPFLVVADIGYCFDLYACFDAPAYRPRRPHDTLLHRVVREHLETFLAYARESYDAPLPKYVRDELRG